MYLLDTNVYITAFKCYYHFDLVPKFWDFLAEQSRCAKVRTIDKVRDELLVLDDELTQWIKNADGAMFESCDRPEVIYEYQRIQKWAQSCSDFKQSAKLEFATVADAWLVAHAKACGHTVITHERFSPDAKRRILIPNACKQFGVPHDEPFAMLKALGAKF